MVYPEIICNILLDNLIRQTRSQKETLIELSYKSYPFDDFKFLINKIIEISKKILFELQNLKNEISQKGSSEDTNDNIILYSDILQYMQNLCKYIEISTVENVPPCLINFMENISKYFQEESSFFLIPVYQTNYYFKEISIELRNKFRRCISNIDDIFPIGGKKISLIMYPFAYKNCIFTMSLLIHELGHYVESKHNIVNNMFSNIKIDSEYVDKIMDKISRRRIGDTGRTLDHFLSRPLMIDVIKNHIVSIINNWLKELFCDLFAFYLIGPAYFISMVEFILSLTKADIGDFEHPPLEMRLKILLNEYDKGDFKKILQNSDNLEIKKFSNHITKITEFIKGTYIRDLSEYSEENYAYQTINQLFLDIEKEVQKIIMELDIMYQPNIYKEEVPILIKSIKNLIIPCELSQGIPANMLSIVNAALIYKIEMFKEHYNEISKIINMEITDFEYKIDELIARGIEICTIQHLMK